MGDTVIVETPVDEVVSIVTAGPQGPSGSEAATLTTTGDLLYRAALANDRLPIGSEGQVLKVSSGLPAWGDESSNVAPHASSHGPNGADPVFQIEAITLTADTTLTAARAKRWKITVNSFVLPDIIVELPITSAQAGDLLEIEFYSNTGRRIQLKWNGAVSSINMLNGQRTVFVAESASAWYQQPVANHSADAIVSGTLSMPRGGLGSDISSYDNQLPKIRFGSISPVNISLAGEALLDDADAAAQRTTLGLGTAATVSANQDLETTDNVVFTGIDVQSVITKSFSFIDDTTDFSAELQASGVLSDDRTYTLADASGTIALTADIPDPSSATPQALGTAAAGTSDDYSRADHIHAAPALNDLSNVSAAAPSDNDVLVFDNATSTWVAEAPAAGGIAGSTGSTDNALLRADGTGGATAQGSALQLDDFTTSTQNNVTLRVRQAKFAMTADASTDIITATGHTFSDNDPVSFSELVGGGGLGSTATFYVRDVSGDTFKVSTSAGGAVRNITSNATAGYVELVAAMVLTTPNMAQFIVGPKPDGTTHGGNARGEAAIDIQPARSGTPATQVANGFGAIAMGNGCTASGTRSVAIGNNATATGIYATAVGGWGNFATARNGAVFGGTSALADRALRAYCAHSNSASGHRQELQAFMSQTTTNDTPTEMFLDQYLNARLTVPSGKVMGGIVCVVGSRSTGAEVALYTRQFVIKNVGGTTTLLSESTIGTDYEDVAGTDITVEANDTNDALRVLVTGVASQNWRWTGWVHATEHFYGT